MRANIPDDWNGEDWTSKCIQWPDSPLWISILYGLINMVSRGRNWTNDSGTIKDAIEVGNEIWARFQASEGCDSFMDVRQNPDNPCELDKDQGSGWVQFADLTLCGASMFEDPPYNGPDFELSADDCLDATIVAWEFYTILLELNTQRASASNEQDMFFRVLTALSTKIAFPNVNQLLALSSALWAGSNAGFAESFITAFRQDMTCELLAQLPSGTSLFVLFQEARDILAAFIAGYEFEGSIPGLAEQVALYLIQAMHTADFMLMYYQSEIEEGDCSQCGGAWCYRFDFATDDGDWVAIPNAHVSGAIWTTGVGWEDTYFCGSDPQGTYLQIGRNLSVRDITRIAFRFYQENLDYEQQWSFMQVRLKNNNGDLIASLDFEPGAVGWNEEEFTTGWEDVARIEILIAQASCPDRNGLILQWLEVEGTSANPFGSDNCT